MWWEPKEINRIDTKSLSRIKEKGVKAIRTGEVANSPWDCFLGSGTAARWKTFHRHSDFSLDSDGTGREPGLDLEAGGR